MITLPEAVRGKSRGEDEGVRSISRKDEGSRVMRGKEETGEKTDEEDSTKRKRVAIANVCSY